MQHLSTIPITLNIAPEQICGIHQFSNKQSLPPQFVPVNPAMQAHWYSVLDLLMQVPEFRQGCVKQGLSGRKEFINTEK